MIQKIIANDYLILALRLLLGLTFVVASVDKIAEPGMFAKAIENYKLISGPVAMLVATLLPWIELLSGLGMLSGIYRQGSAFVLFTLLAVFTVAVITGVIRGLDISCGCFTLDPEVNRIGLWKILENIGLMVASIVVFFSQGRQFVMRIE